MEIRGEAQNHIRSAIPSSYGLVERRREGGNNSNGDNHNGTTAATLPPTTPTVLTYTQTLDHHPHPRPGGSTATRYRECLRNHAASVGGNVYDGCGEFMPGGEEGTLEALKCAACECHRNFHRKETEGETAMALTQFSPRRRNVNSAPHSANAASPMVPSLQLPAISYHHHHHHHPRFPPVVHPMSVAFGGGSGGGGESSSEELTVYPPNNNVELGFAPPPPHYVLSKKRFRTKFTQEQKEKMMEFAEKIGWRINRQEEGEVERFCEELGVTRQVFKVWMHNNKNLKKGAANPEEPEQDHQHQPAGE